MEVSKLTFSDEFREKTKRKLTSQDIGRLRWNRLVQLENDGTLQKATKRDEVAKLVGIKDYRNGYVWVANMVRRGVIKEIIVGYENNKAIYEYHTGKPLEYKSGRRGRKSKQKDTIAETLPTVTKIEEPVIIARVNSDKTIAMTIMIDDVSIKAENVEVDYLASLIKALTK